MGSLVAVIDRERAASNAEMLIRYSREGRGVFSRSLEALHPQLPLPTPEWEGGELAAIYRLIGSGVDRKGLSMQIWGRHRQFFSSELPSCVASWSRAQEAEYLQFVNAILWPARTSIDVPSWVQWYRWQYDSDAPASENSSSLARVKGFGKHTAAVAVQYLFDMEGLTLDPHYKPKADLHDVRFSLITGELKLENLLPRSDLVESLVSELMRDAANDSGVDKSEYKRARWALMRSHLSTGLDRASGTKRAEVAGAIMAAYPGLFVSLDSWVRNRLGRYEHNNRHALADVPLNLFPR